MSAAAPQIAVAWVAAEQAFEVTFEVAPNTTVAALSAMERFRQRVPRAVLDAAAGIGVWGKVRPANYTLRDGDRVEIYAALKVDPKEQRRRRAG